MVLRAFTLVVLLTLSGCGNTGPGTTHTTSAKFSTLAERASFLHQYVSFRRTYETLDFDLRYQNNGEGLVPGPSEWDIKIVATVPEAELAAWIPPVPQLGSAPDLAWLKTVPTNLDLTGPIEWYEDGKRVVGVDRTRRIVVYRLLNN